ncbi:MAG: MarR family transcriptional regulator [Acidobacteria bacterium]|nr:MarR family transcriptional regulator [Acidobacteriota bacterium]
MSIENTVSYLLAKAGTAHRNLIEKRAQEIGLHGGQIFVLVELWKTDGLRQIDLASRLNLSAATVNRTIGGLIGNDFVTRQNFENDARSTRICLTKKGIEIRPHVEALWKAIDMEATGGLTDAEVTMLGQILPRLVVEIV